MILMYKEDHACVRQFAKRLMDCNCRRVMECAYWECMGWVVLERAPLARLFVMIILVILRGVCHIEFGVGSKLFRLQEILRRLTRTDEELIKSFSEDECKDRLKRSLKRKVLLAIDNVSDAQNIVNEAMDLLRVGFPEGCIVIVTARLQSQLGYLKVSAEECIEMPNLEEDDARSLFLYHAAPGSYLKNADKANKQLLKECVVRCHFGKGDGISYHYHPLALKTLGGQFGNDPEEWVKNLNEVDVFNRHQEDDKDHPIYSILGISFEKLRLEDKYLFMDATIFVPHEGVVSSLPYFNPINTIDWLSMVHGRSVSDIKRRLEGLKNKSLLENLGEGSGRICVHDLWRGFAAVKAEVGEFELRPWVFEKAYVPRREESCLSRGGWESLQRVGMTLGTKTEFFGYSGFLFRVPNILGLDKREAEYGQLLQLQTLDLYDLALLELLDLSRFPQLKKLAIKSCKKLTGLTSSAPLIFLEYLELKSCKSLEVMPDLNHLVALRDLILFRLRSL